MHNCQRRGWRPHWDHGAAPGTWLLSFPSPFFLLRLLPPPLLVPLSPSSSSSSRRGGGTYVMGRAKFMNGLPANSYPCALFGEGVLTNGVSRGGAGTLSSGSGSGSGAGVLVPEFGAEVEGDGVYAVRMVTFIFFEPLPDEVRDITLCPCGAAGMELIGVRAPDPWGEVNDEADEFDADAAAPSVGNAPAARRASSTSRSASSASLRSVSAS